MSVSIGYLLFFAEVVTGIFLNALLSANHIGGSRDE